MANQMEKLQDLSHSELQELLDNPERVESMALESDEVKMMLHYTFGLHYLSLTSGFQGVFAVIGQYNGHTASVTGLTSCIEFGLKAVFP